MRSIIKKFVPEFLLKTRRRILVNLPDKEYKNLPLTETFKTVYEMQIWGKSDDPSELFCSGEGSHNPEVVSVYCNAVINLLNSFDRKLDIVDLGCGDFNIGSRIRPSCNNYIACDVVEQLIERNKQKFNDIGVDFRVLDITNDKLPFGDIVFIRQVLQHLSNKQIFKVVQKLQGKYEYLVLTEHLPIAEHFTPNLDKPAGPNIRLGLSENGSGIVLTKRPFNLKVKDEKILCEVSSDGGIIRTILYRF